MTGNGVQYEIEMLRIDILFHRERYYSKNLPTEISNHEYDCLMEQLEYLEEKNPKFDNPESPSHKRGK